MKEIVWKLRNMQRTPRHFDGTAKTGKLLSEILPEAVRGIREKAGQGGDEIFSFWLELIGDKMGPLTEAVSFVDGLLTVKVKSASLYSLLCQHERPRLLRQLQEKFPVRSLVFRVG
jgi:hypothetical protein